MAQLRRLSEADLADLASKNQPFEYTDADKDIHLSFAISENPSTLGGFSLCLEETGDPTYLRKILGKTLYNQLRGGKRADWEQVNTQGHDFAMDNQLSKQAQG